MTKKFDMRNNTPRPVMTPLGIADLDFVSTDGTAWVWLGRRDSRTNKMRSHIMWDVEELMEVEE